MKEPRTPATNTVRVEVAAPAHVTPIFDAAGQRLGWLNDATPEATAVSRELNEITQLRGMDRAGLRIYCTLDSDLEKKAAAVVSDRSADTLQVSLLALENESGAIRALAGADSDALRAEASEAAMYANGGARHAPFVITRVCSLSGELLFQAEACEEQALPAAVAWSELQKQQAAVVAQLGSTGREFPATGPGRSESSHSASFTAATRSLSCSVQVAPNDPATVLARGHAESVAQPAWLELMRAAAESTWPAVAFEAPVETIVADEIPLVRRAVAVVHEPEVRRAIAVNPSTFAFGGLADNPLADLRPVEPRVERAIPVNQALVAQQALVTRPVGLDDGPVSTGSGFVVFPRAVRRDAIGWSR